jgi:hypothetical protein
MIIVRQRFRRELGLNLENDVVFSLAGYSEASALMLDFLAFCRCPAVACTDSVEQMCAAIPVFEREARKSLGAGEVPLHEHFEEFEFTTSCWLPGLGPSLGMLRRNRWRAARTIRGTYDCRAAEELRQVLDAAPPWLRRPLEREVGELHLPDVPAVLAADMHLHACAQITGLARAAAEDEPADSLLPTLLTEAFASLRQHLRRCVGLTDRGTGHPRLPGTAASP